MPIEMTYSITFEGRLSENNLIDFYDVSEALSGFQRSLALTTHLVLNNEIITQAPALKNARIYASAPEAGSWKFVTVLGMLAYGTYQLGTAPKDTVIGHLMISAYDYVIKSSLGFHVDFNSTIGKQIEELDKNKIKTSELTVEKMDSLMEKCENSIKSMHRPIVFSGTAEKAKVLPYFENRERMGQELNSETYAFINVSNRSDKTSIIYGKISSYNVNTYKGRIYDIRNKRPIPFELGELVRRNKDVALITSSLNSNALNRNDFSAYLKITAYEVTSSSNRLKFLVIVDVEQVNQKDIEYIIEIVRRNNEEL